MGNYVSVIKQYPQASYSWVHPSSWAEPWGFTTDLHLVCSFDPFKTSERQNTLMSLATVWDRLCFFDFNKKTIGRRCRMRNKKACCHLHTCDLVEAHHNSTPQNWLPCFQWHPLFHLPLLCQRNQWRPLYSFDSSLLFRGVTVSFPRWKLCLCPSPNSSSQQNTLNLCR